MSGWSFCIDDELFRSLHSQGRILKAIREDQKLTELRKIPPHTCISEQFFRDNIIAVIIEDYDEEVGLTA
ncbi:MAG: hypothetical protein QXR28_01110 [Nitrososphaerota archaeon]